MKNNQLSGAASPIAPPNLNSLHPNKMKGCSYKLICKKEKMNRKGFAPITIQYFINGRKGEYGTGISLPPHVWDDDNQMVKAKYLEYQDHSLIIEQTRADFSKVLVTLRLQKVPITKELIKRRLEFKSSNEDFLVYFAKKIEERYREKVIGEDTRKTHLSKLKMCKEFRSVWLFSEINEKFLNRYRNWYAKHLQKFSIEHERPLKNNGHNTIMSSLKVIRTYLIAAEHEDGIIFEQPSILINWVPTSRDFLPESMLNILIDAYNIDYYVDDFRLKEALEVALVVSCTGLRVSDIKRLRKMHFNNNTLTMNMHKGRRKTPTVLTLPVNDFLKKIIASKYDYIFPGIVEQKINERLKIVAHQLGIEKSLSMHVFRHTFATLFLQKGGTLTALKELMGHKSEKSTELYIHNDPSYTKKEFENSISKIFNRKT